MEGIDDRACRWWRPYAQFPTRRGRWSPGWTSQKRMRREEHLWQVVIMVGALLLGAGAALF